MSQQKVINVFRVRKRAKIPYELFDKNPLEIADSLGISQKLLKRLSLFIINLPDKKLVTENYEPDKAVRVFSVFNEEKNMLIITEFARKTAKFIHYWLILDIAVPPMNEAP